MAEPIETLTQQLIHRATDPFSLAILTGVTSSSFWLFGSLGLVINGPMPATVTQSARAKKDISETSALKMWEWVFNRAKVRFSQRSPPPIPTRATSRLYENLLSPCTHRLFRRYILHRLHSLPEPPFW